MTPSSTTSVPRSTRRRRRPTPGSARSPSCASTSEPACSSTSTSEPSSAEPYRRALAWLFQFADPERGVGWNPRSSPDEGWKLARPRALLDLAGSPDRAQPLVVVAGTNGKGSTVAILDSILRAAGWRIGIYTQPHLHSYRERMQVEGEPVSIEAFCRGIDALRPHVSELARRHPDAGEPTTFELTTVLAAIVFAEAGLDLAIFEVGLGGRLDAVNAMDASLVLVTPIGLDHTRILGRRLGAIAGEKAGVLRSGVLALSAQQRPTVARALRDAARARQAPLQFIAPLEPTAAPTRHGAQMVRLGLHGESGTAALALAGPHQRQNAALAVAAATALQSPVHPIERPAVLAGLAGVRWPGRLEWVGGSPEHGISDVVLDGAHNPPGAAALASALDEVAPGRPIELVLGSARDKDVEAMLRPLTARARHVWTTAADDARAADPRQLVRIVDRLGGKAEPFDSVVDALARARTAAADGALVVVAGSLRVVADARVALRLPVTSP